MISDAREWRNRITSDARALLRMPARMRKDPEFPWGWYNQFDPIEKPKSKRSISEVLRNWLGRIDAGEPEDLHWIELRFAELFDIRSALCDEFSRASFDSHLLLRVAGPWRYNYSRQAHDYVQVLDCGPFSDLELSSDYMGLQLREMHVRIGPNTSPIKVITTPLQAQLLTGFGQYFPEGAAAASAAEAGDVVLDCGACIGDMSVIYATVVGSEGKVYAFDPIEHHLKYGARQTEINPQLLGVIEYVKSAVGNENRISRSDHREITSISADFSDISAMPCIRIDDFVAQRSLERVDLIKMDIEGSEVAALRGAAETIRKYRPKLAVSAYHNREHLVDILQYIHSLDPSYKFGFAQHSPVVWEAVLYAWCE